VVIMSHQQQVHTHHETLGEIIANSVTHGLGALLGIAGLVVLIVHAARAGSAWHVVSFSIFGSTLMLLYFASTLYHSITNPTGKYVFKILDHAAIFLFIAGSYTPFMLTTLRGAWGWSIFGVIWGSAILGILLKCLCIGKFRKLSVALYIVMGWFCLIVFKELMTRLPPLSLIFLVLGGLSYTFGVIFYAWRRLPYNHAVWHLFVLTGSIGHYFAVLFSV